MTTLEALEDSIFASALLSLRMGSDLSLSQPSEDHSKYRKANSACRIHAASDRAPSGVGMDILPLSLGDDSRRKRANMNVSSTSSECSENEKSFCKPSVVIPNLKGEKKGGKNTRGRYKCSLCGELKTNHVCALVTDKLMCSVGTQSCSGRSIVLTPQVREAICGGSDRSEASAGCASGFTSSFASSSLSSTSFAQGEADAYLPSLSQSLDLSVPQACQGLTYSNQGLSNLSSLSWSLSSSSLSGAGVASVPGSAVKAPAAAASAADSGIAAIGGFQERVITVSRNRPSIHVPLPGRTDTGANKTKAIVVHRMGLPLAPVREEGTSVSDAAAIESQQQQQHMDSEAAIREKECGSSDDTSITADDTDGDGSYTNDASIAAH